MSSLPSTPLRRLLKPKRYPASDQHSWTPLFPSSSDIEPCLRSGTTEAHPAKPWTRSHQASPILQPSSGESVFFSAPRFPRLSVSFGTGVQLKSRSHEIAYIFGQLSSPHSIPSLLSRLRDPSEDPMVRHEAAEALGGIADDGAGHADQPGGVLGVLREWAARDDAPQVVRESCQVAIDMWEYERSGDQFNPLDAMGGATGLERSSAGKTLVGVA